MGSALDLYADAFVARFGRPSDRVRLLVVDDRDYRRLVAEVTSARSGVVDIFANATRCDEFIRRRPGWIAEQPSTAMALRDVDAVPAVALPDGLALRPVPEGVALEEAVAVAIAADPRITEPPAAFAEFLRSLPSSVRLFAAVDEDGVARATSGYDIFGAYARVFFVNTDHGWRRRGVGRAMTVAAVRAAASSGARRIVLDASDAGVSVYRRLGFEAAGTFTRYHLENVFDTV